MRRSVIIVMMCALLATMLFAISGDAQGDNQQAEAIDREAKREARREKRVQRLAAYDRHLDSLVNTNHFRFVPQTMQQLPAGMMRNLANPCYELVVMGSEVDVCLPFLKGYTPPYYPVLFNYVLTSVRGYNIEEVSDGWHITFQSTMYSSTDYTFSLEIYSHYGGAMLTLSSPFYNSVQYSGNIMGI